MSAHHEELQEIENVKYYWNKGGKWVVVALVAAALGYLVNVIYQGQVESKNKEAATLAAQIKGDTAKLQALQQSHSASSATAQATLETAKSLFDNGKLDEAATAYRWVLDNHKAPLFQAAATQNLANVLLQQKKFDEALALLNNPIDAHFAPAINEIKGDVYAAQGKAAEAKQAYQAALDTLPENALGREFLEMKIGAL
ncbi:YfgM family protein [Alysiella filiformis]|uniref:Ancillary SecYEG translocon subunit n=1 Tax=Alysiella filiformis DSM 16848 TaxID=1120981 RepID=A0A286E263_9NEIS|nr:tetratricopeptide repeat protein [Alysiella filiformis]QMT30856.1 tetratricopeptide repeat protein [Alysiella filiformis]UBQ56162.1 tetratricopeptide repeat protein [Alysiella filiformis DSM 16848]SOD64981.1 Putative negative regulator of RcsB-dependent stress response [Alysiella filiformis DSM 16848]